VALVVFFPVIEWVIHVVILHWRPRKVGGVPVDSLLARKHRAHHADPRVLPLVFIPWQVELWLLPSYVVIGVFAFPGQSAGATFMLAVGALMFNYEWVHYLVHSDYRPRSKAFRAVWRNHRLHHYKNEHYWFTVTSSGTADRLFGTYPDSGEVRTSETVRQLHALEEGRAVS
jgi:sterol desaturase/sphingolipid hydroxylase (fatty acid hydroxylase superfamily)